MEKVSLVLEGGGLRGVYTSGVLDCFLDKNMEIPYVIGVSAGACQAFSYLSKQKGRSFRTSYDYIGDSRYLSLRNLVREGSIFGMNFVFGDIPDRLLPFDYDTYNKTVNRFVIAATNCITGRPEYFEDKDAGKMLQYCRASSSLPLVSPPVWIGGMPYFDGGVSDPIPINRAIGDGNRKHVVVLTRNLEYRKKQDKKSLWLIKRMYGKYPKLAETYAKRYLIYNQTLEQLHQMEKRGTAFIIQPQKPVTVGRLEKNKEKLKAFYEEGYEEATALYQRLIHWLAQP